MIQEAIQKVLNNQSLMLEEAADCGRQLFKGELSPAQAGAFLMALAVKGESKSEVLGMLKALREHMISVEPVEDVVDVCGTGGDKLQTFNTSTAASIVASAAGARVAKAGNRSATSPCGSADLLEAAGVLIELKPSEVKRWLAECGYAFLFSPLYHPALKPLTAIRRELGVRTILNMLGPLGNPLCPTRQLLGVSKQDDLQLYAEILAELKVAHAMIVHGLDGMDEITLCSPTDVIEVRHGEIQSWRFDPSSLGLRYISLEEIRGGDAKDNYRLLLQVVQGGTGPIRDIVCVNAAAVLVVAGRAENLQEGFLQASHALDTGAAFKKLEELVQRSHVERGAISHVHA